eukprot:1105566-Rhodomonas_salina.1
MALVGACSRMMGAAKLQTSAVQCTTQLSFASFDPGGRRERKMERRRRGRGRKNRKEKSVEDVKQQGGDG